MSKWSDLVSDQETDPDSKFRIRPRQNVPDPQHLAVFLAFFFFSIPIDTVKENIKRYAEYNYICDRVHVLHQYCTRRYGKVFTS